MSDKQRKGAPGADILGLILFLAGAFSAMLVIVAIFRGVPAEGAAGTGAMARSMILRLGHAPVLLMTLGFAGLGVAAFLGGGVKNLTRHISGYVGVAVGLAVLLGVFSETAGGVVGAASGGFLSSTITVIPATLLGLIALIAPIWFTWLRDLGLFPAKNSNFDHLAGTMVRGEELGSDESSAVSAEEAEALLPDPDITSNQRAVSAALEEALKNDTVPTWAAKDESEFPYPEDARLKGEIPQGALPLDDSGETEEANRSEASDDQAGSTNRWTPARNPEVADATDESVAGKSTGQPKFVDVTPVAEVVTEVVAVVEELTSPVPSAETPAGTQALNYDEVTPRPLWETETDAAAQAVTVEESEEELEAEPVRASSNRWVPSTESDAAGAPKGREPNESAISGSDEVWEVVEASDDEADPWESDAVPEELEDYEEVLVPAPTAESLPLDEEEEELEQTEEFEVAAELEDGTDDEELEEEDLEVLEIPIAAAPELEESVEVVEEPADEDEEWEYVEVAEDDEDGEWEEVEDEEDEEEEEEEEELTEQASDESEEDAEEQADGEFEEEWEYVEVAEGEEGWEDAEEAPELESDPQEEESTSSTVAQDDSEEEQETSDEEIYEEEFAVLLAEEVTTGADDLGEDEPLVEAPIETAAEAEPEPEEEPVALAEAEPEPEEEPVAVAKEEPKPEIAELADQVQMDLFGDPSPEPVAVITPSASPEASSEVSDDPEPVKTLVPQAAGANGASPEALLAAELILVEERVAVSLLQRSIGLDFKESCGVLDELQELGFIGPFIDGNRRDILMGREEWLSMVGTE